MEQALEIMGTCLGILYLWLEYRASIYLWIVGILMPSIYLGVYYQAGLYADFGINIYYLLAALYGAWYWMRGKREQAEKQLPIVHTPRSQYLPLALAFLTAFLLIGYILICFTNSDVPWWDSFTTALSIVGMWMLARKQIEQWWAWLAVDVVSCGLYIYKEIYFTAALYGLYSIVVFFGYKRWKQLMHQTSFS